MVSTDVLFRIADAAEDSGDYELARKSFERGAALGDSSCLCRLAYLYDLGMGVDTDKAKAMRLYQRAWRNDRNTVAGMNIATLYREQKNWPRMFSWWQRVAAEGDGDAQLEMAKCFLRGQGVERDQMAAIRCLAAATSSDYITEYARQLAERLLGKFRLATVQPCTVSQPNPTTLVHRRPVLDTGLG